MEYPLLLKGEELGQLSVEKQGLYTVMEARAPGAEGLVRLWVQGEGREAYLGVMQPWEGGLCLKRRLSRMELAAFPEKIERASDCRLDEVYITNNAGAEEEKAGAEEAGKGGGMETEAAPETEDPEEPGDKGKRAGAEQGGNRDGPCAEARADPPPAAGRAGEDMSCGAVSPGTKAPQDTAGELVWRERRDGSLVTRTVEGCLVALPAKLRTVPPGARLRRIGGREYLVFRY